MQGVVGCVGNMAMGETRKWGPGDTLKATPGMILQTHHRLDHVLSRGGRAAPECLYHPTAGAGQDISATGQAMDEAPRGHALIPEAAFRDPIAVALCLTWR